MGLKCSLLGHSFGDVDVERDREERGDEVVTIVREVERCTRCGRTRVVSENKEVTTVVEPEDVGVDRDAGAGAGTGFGTGGAGADAGPDVDAGSATGAGTGTGTGTGAGTGAADATGTDDLDEYEPPEDPEEEDAEIIEDDGPAEREPGQWPDDEEASFEADSLTGGAGGAGPTDADEGGPGGAGPGEGADAAADPETTDDGSGAGWSDATDSASDVDASGADAAGSDDAGFDDEAEILGGGSARDRDDVADGDFTVPEGRYVCPECGYRIEASGSSLREGDACPECQRGYLRAEDGERNP